MISYIKKHKILFLVSVVVLFLILIVFNFKNVPGQLSPTLSPVQQSLFWDNFKPGDSQKADVVGQLGQPISEKTVNGQAVDDFKSNSPTRNHEVFFNKNTSVFFRQIVAYNDKLSIQDIHAKYGDTENVLYGPDSLAGFYLYVYPDKGFAYLGNKKSGTVLEVWYFKPVNVFQDFIGEVNNWIQGYSVKQTVSQ